MQMIIIGCFQFIIHKLIQVPYTLHIYSFDFRTTQLLYDVFSMTLKSVVNAHL